MRPSSANLGPQPESFMPLANPQDGAPFAQVLDDDNSTQPPRRYHSSRGAKRRRSESLCRISSNDTTEHNPGHPQNKTAVELNGGLGMRVRGNYLTNQPAQVGLEDSSRGNQGQDYNSDIGQREPNNIPPNVSRGPHPDGPGSSAVSNNYPILLQDSSYIIPCGPQPNDPGSLAIEDCLDGVL
ncbi:hypothetical protein BBP40_004059 [Aspergillus hancockii]|nr:hypothetical protein BBP40_004059 [Aspergillus hancockii]